MVLRYSPGLCGVKVLTRGYVVLRYSPELCGVKVVTRAMWC